MPPLLQPHLIKAVLNRHAHMVLDRYRTHPLRLAIDRTIQQGDIVIDIGTGIGLLAFFACRAGAQHVYAIDVDSESLAVAECCAQAFGFSKRITFIEGTSMMYKPEKKADVVICEVIGSAAFDENILATLAHAQRHLLKRNGRIIPQEIELWGAPFTTPRASRRRAKAPRGSTTTSPAKNLHHGKAFLDSEPWSNVEGFNFSLIEPSLSRASQRLQLHRTATTISPSSLLAPPEKLIAIEVGKQQQTKVHVTSRITFSKAGMFSGIALWPRVTWGYGSITDASPFQPLTHWGQSSLKFKQKTVARGNTAIVELIIQPDPHRPWQQTEMLWRRI